MLTAWEKRTTDYKLGKKPLVVFLEKDKKIIKSLMYVNNFYYELSSPLQAIEVTFKAFFSLQVEYPKESSSTWMVIQKRIYKMESESDVIIPSVFTFLSELQQSRLV